MNGFPIIDVAGTGKKIKKAMQDAEMTMGSVSRELGFGSVHTVSSWVNGRAVPRIDNLIVLSHLFNMPIEDLIEVKWTGGDTDATKG